MTPLFEQQKFQEYIDAVRGLAFDPHPVAFFATPLDWFYLVATVQVALQHPHYPPKLANEVRLVAEMIGQEISHDNPTLAELIRKSWAAQPPRLLTFPTQNQNSKNQ